MLSNKTSIIPKIMQSVVLEGSGFEHLQVKNIPVPEPNNNQILCRVDAATVCTSILKLISQGSEHNFLNGWDLKKIPITIGDEGAVTAVKIGKNLKNKFKIGEKLAIQPAVDHKPINFLDRYRHPEQMKKVAVGYTLGGSFSQYILILEEVITTGCLVKLPTQDLGYYEISLSEPLSCVISSQDHHVHLLKDKNGERQPVKGLKKDGVTVIFGAGAMGRLHIELAITYKPRVIVVFDLLVSRLNWIKDKYQKKAKKAGVQIICLQPSPQNLPSQLVKYTGQHYADDIIDATGIREVQEEAVNTIAGPGSVFNSFGGLAVGKNLVQTDMRKIHYDESIITGSSGGNPWDTRRTLDLIASGSFDVGSQVKMIGSLKHASQFLQMIKDKKLDGKAVIYPQTDIDQPIEVDSWTRKKEIRHIKARMAKQRASVL